MNSNFARTLLFLLIALSLQGCEKEQRVSQAGLKKIPVLLGEADTGIYRTNASEDLILRLSKDLEALRDRLTGKTNSYGTLFDSTLTYVGPENISITQLQSNNTTSNGNASVTDWPLTTKKPGVPPDQVWQPIQSIGFSEFQLGIVSGTFPDDDLETFHMTAVIEGKLKTESSNVLGIKAKQMLVWNLDESGHWKIDKWIQKELSVTTSRQTLFEDVTEKLIRSKETLNEIRHAILPELLIAESEKKQHAFSDDKDFEYFNDWRSSSQYPSVSVVDFDGDGWEDLFFTSGFGRSFLLKNVNGTHFEDVTKESGLYLEKSLATCSLFADFDNDGDPDVLIGRTTKPSLYFQNQNGKFVAVEDANRKLKDCKFVSAGSVADVNGDGLLDVYLSTYVVHGNPEPDLIKRVVPEHQQNQFAKILSQKRDNTLDRPGPPNVLLINNGGILQPARIDEPLLQWRNSYQSVWMDIDLDGDQDLYLCNDFSRDALLRNDTVKGSQEIKFTDVSSQYFSASLTGFGMGASVGDYNSDGLLDLYVSNMYSKAGHRVFTQIGGSVDSNLQVAARGNFLYRNNGNGFEQVAGLYEGQRVAKVGWSFGGQMADFNNDCRLDLYVPSGLFTAPEKIRAHEDL